jgi:hypothetical protein
MPRLNIEDCVSYEVKGAMHLTDYLVRFQLVSPRRISKYEEFVLHGRQDVDALLPPAPNRKAVLYNLNAVKKNLDDIFFRVKKGWFARQFKIESPLDFLRLSIDHTSNPSYVFTNGQSFASVVVRDEQRFEIVWQSTRMSAPYQEIHALIDPDAAGCFTSYSAAETAIRSRLSKLEFRAVSWAMALTMRRCYCNLRELLRKVRTSLTPTSPGFVDRATNFKRIGTSIRTRSLIRLGSMDFELSHAGRACILNSLA